MFLKQKTSGHLVEIQDLAELFDPYKETAAGRLHYGEEAQDTEQFAKHDLCFPSGEDLPCCWTDPHYRDAELKR